MSELFATATQQQTGFAFPQSLTEKYRPQAAMPITASTGGRRTRDER